MLIALDYDGTYTLDPRLWDRFVADAMRSGHAFVVVTGRREPPRGFRADIPVVCVPDGYKRDGARRAGFLPDVWIDDMPEMIGEGRILKFD